MLKPSRVRRVSTWDGCPEQGKTEGIPAQGQAEGARMRICAGRQSGTGNWQSGLGKDGTVGISEPRWGEDNFGVAGWGAWLDLAWCAGVQVG